MMMTTRSLLDVRIYLLILLLLLSHVENAVVVVVAFQQRPPVLIDTPTMARGVNIATLMTLPMSMSSEEEMSDDNDTDVDDDDDDDIEIKPYGSRSLAWTKRYRRLNPYEKVRQRVIRFGHRSKADWDDAVSSGQLGQYVPSYPEKMYEPEWISWDEFLGLTRSYTDTQNIAVNVLGLKTLDEYIMFVRSNPKRAEGLRIPVRPDLYYKDEWIDENTFFNTKKD